MKRLFISLMSFVFLSGALPAAEPVMTYQGRLKEANAPVTGNRNFIFEFCGQETGGTCTSSPDGAQSFAAVNGLFKSTFTVPAVNLSAGPWYLQASVGGVPLLPREKLTFVPYSVYASTAGYAAGAARVLLADNVSISSESLAAFGGGVRISSNVYIVGFSSAAAYYGDGSGLTGVTGASGTDVTKVLKAGDTMTGQLTLSGSSLTVTSASGVGTANVRLNPNVELSSTTAANYGGVYASSHVFVNGDLRAANLYGDGSALLKISSITAGAVGPNELAQTAVTPATYGDGTHVGQFTVDADGRLTLAQAVTITGAAPTGSAGGDLTGNFPNPNVGAGVLQSTHMADGAISTAKLAAGAVIDAKVLLSTAAISSGKFGDDRVAITTGGITGGFNTADKLVQLAADGKLTDLDGSALLKISSITAGAVGPNELAATAVAAGAYGDGTHVGQFTVDVDGRLTAASTILIAGASPTGSAGGDLTGNFPNPNVGAGVLQSTHMADGAISTAKLAAGAVIDAKVLLSTAAISSGKFGDDRVAITTGGITGGFNTADKLVQLDADGKLTNLDGSALLRISSITAGAYENVRVGTATIALSLTNGLYTLTQSTFSLYNLTASSITTTGAGVIFSTNVFITNGNVGIGTTGPKEALDVNGAVKIGAAAGTLAGTMQYSGGHFQGYNGASWANFDVSGGGWTNGAGTIFPGNLPDSVGIGIVPAGHKLQVYDSNSTIGQHGMFSRFYLSVGIPTSSYGIDGSKSAVVGLADSSVPETKVFGVAGYLNDASQRDSAGVFGGADRGAAGINPNTWGALGYRDATPTEWAGYFKGNSYFAGNIGIGTTNPVFQLHVAGSGSTIAGLTASANSTDAAVYGWANSGASAIKGVASGGYAGRFEGNVYMGDATAIAGSRLVVKGATSDASNSALNATDSGGSSLLYIRNDGAVGIGTTGPGSRLEVYSNASAAGPFLRLTNAGAGNYAAGIDLRGNPPGGGTAFSAGRIYGIIDAAGYANTRLTFANATGEGTFSDTMSLKNGNVGIGTTEPVGRLTIAQDEVNDAGGTAGQLKITGINTNKRLILGYDTTSDYGYIEATDMGVWRNLALQANGGNVGIGTTGSAAFKLETAGDIGPEADNTRNLGSSGRRWANIYAANFVGSIVPGGFTQGPVVFGGAGGALAQDSSLFWDNANKRLGIGTTGPGAKLDVAGDVNTSAVYQIAGSTVFAILPGIGSLGIGVNAGVVNVGNYNVFIGSAAGASNTTGGGNTFVGYYAGLVNTTGGFNNTFLGVQAGYFNDTGNENSFVGAGAGFRNTTGKANSFVGSQAGFYNQTGSANSILGTYAGGVGTGSNTFFSSSTIIGYKAGYNLMDDGNDNIFLGFQAGFNVQTGTGNIIIGYNKGTPAPGTSNHLNIGGVIYGDLAAGNVGIGTTNPGAKLDVRGADTQAYNLAVGTSTTYSMVVSTGGNVGIGTTAPTTVLHVRGAVGIDAENRIDTISAAKSILGLAKDGIDYGQLYLDNTTGNVVLYQKYPSGNLLLGTNSATNVTIQNSGNVGIGTTGPDVALDVNGYTQLGSDAPKIKMKKLTGTTASTEGGVVDFPHGLTASKIISITVMVEQGSGYFVPPGSTTNAVRQFDWMSGPVNITVYNHSTNSEDILSKPIKVLVVYEE